MLRPAAPFHIKPRLSLDLLAWLARFARSATDAPVRRAAPLLRDLSLASRGCYDDWAAQPHVDFGLVKNGLLVLCRSAHSLHEESATAAYARQLGMPAELHIGRDALALDPTLRTDIAGAIHYPLDCHLSPDRLMQYLEAEVQKAGGTFAQDTEIVGWRSDTNATRVLAARTRDGREIEAGEFVLCAGAWSPETVRDLGLTLPIQAGKGYSVTLPTFARVPAHCAILAEARVAVTPMNGGVRVGGTMELAGLTRDINPPRVRAIVEALSSYYAAMGPEDFAGIAPWSGLRPCSPDGLPYIGRTRQRANLTIAAGHAMMGVTLGPVTGNIVAMLLSGEPPPFDMAQLSPDRF
jgi:D-amino-acid dehydrogenase